MFSFRYKFCLEAAFLGIKGERVKIKRKYAEILDNSEHQDYETSCLIEQKSKEFEAATKALG